MNKAILFGVAASATALACALTGVESGLNVGDMVTPFNPTHIAGPDKGTNKCPP